MSVVVPTWPEGIRVDVQSPLAILRQLEPSLRERTQGVLASEVTTTTGGEIVEHHFNIIAPRLNYRVSLLAAKHRRDEVYPVVVQSRGFLPAPPRHVMQLTTPSSPVQGLSTLFQRELDAGECEAASQDEFSELVQRVLTSHYAMGLVHSLIARSNEAVGNGNGNGQAKGNSQ